jgi:hypothetical protein
VVLNRQQRPLARVPAPAPALARVLVLVLVLVRDHRR